MNKKQNGDAFGGTDPHHVNELLNILSQMGVKHVEVIDPDAPDENEFVSSAPGARNQLANLYYSRKACRAAYNAEFPGSEFFGAFYAEKEDGSGERCTVIVGDNVNALEIHSGGKLSRLPSEDAPLQPVENPFGIVYALREYGFYGE